MRFCLALAAAVGLLCCSAEASVLGDLLTQNPNENVDSINDNSRAVIFDRNGNDLLDVGDEIVGILQFERVNDVDPSPAGLFSIFALKVTGQRAFGDASIIEHGPIAGGEAHSLWSLLDPSLRPLPGSFNDWDNALFAILEIDELGNNDPKDPFSATNSDPTDDPLGIITNVLTAANGYSLGAILGFGSENDFFDTMPNVFAPLRIGDGQDPLLISEIQADDGGVQIVVESAGMSVLYHALGDIDLLSLGIRRPGPVSTPVTYHDVLLSPDGSIQTSTAEVPNWDLEDDTNFKIHIIPEPGTVALLVSMVTLLGLARGRRRSLRQQQD